MISVVVGDLIAIGISAIVEQFSKPLSLFLFLILFLGVIPIAWRSRSADRADGPIMRRLEIRTFAKRAAVNPRSAAGADRRPPLVELAHHELAEIVGIAPFRQRDIEAGFLQPLAHVGQVEDR